MQKFLFIFLLLGAAPGPLAADYNLNGKTIECFCTDRQGQRVELGDMICLQVDGRMFMAQCQMSLNVPMWREISPGCLSSSLGEAPLGGQSVNPSLHASGVDAKI